MIKLQFLIALILLFIFVGESDASLVSLTKDGEMSIQVLSEEDEALMEDKSDVVVTGVADEKIDNASVSLQKTDGKISLFVEEANEIKELDVTQWRQDIVAIEERPNAQEIKITADNEKFYLRQGGIRASTSLPLSIDAKSARLSAQTSNGQIFVFVSPKQASQTLLKTKLVSRIQGDLDLKEKGEDLVYEVNAVREINLFNVYTLPLNVTLNLSAATGEIKSFENPVWLQKFSFIFS